MLNNSGPGPTGFAGAARSGWRASDYDPAPPRFCPSCDRPESSCICCSVASPLRVIDSLQVCPPNGWRREARFDLELHPDDESRKLLDYAYLRIWTQCHPSMSIDTPKY